MVNDMSIGVDSRDANAVKRLMTAAQRHERTLYATGGKLALHKCTWVIVNCVWTDSQEIFRDNYRDRSEPKLVLKLTQSKDRTQRVISRLPLPRDTKHWASGLQQMVTSAASSDSCTLRWACG